MAAKDEYEEGRTEGREKQVERVESVMQMLVRWMLLLTAPCNCCNCITCSNSQLVLREEPLLSSE